MNLTYRPIKVWPEGWPSPLTEAPYSPFKAGFDSTIDVLDRELSMLDVDEATIQLDISERDARGGRLRADTKVKYRGVILSFDAPGLGALTYSCYAYDNRFGKPSAEAWRQNLRAIALGLEALRKLERYGIANRGQQYAGWREIGTGIPLGEATMSKEDAARFVVDAAELPPEWCAKVIADPETRARVYRSASKRLHPDQGGDAALFVKLGKAKQVLDL